MEDLRETVERLASIEEIRGLKARYFRFVDTKDWDGFAELFTDDLQIDFEESTSRPLTKDQFVASVARHFQGAMSVHHGHVPEIEILDAEHARGIWPMYDLVETPPESEYESHTGWGHYTEEYRKVDGRWLISRTQLTRLKREVLGEKPGTSR